MKKFKDIQAGDKIYRVEENIEHWVVTMREVESVHNYKDMNGRPSLVICLTTGPILRCIDHEDDYVVEYGGLHFTDRNMATAYRDWITVREREVSKEVCKLKYRLMNEGTKMWEYNGTKYLNKTRSNHDPQPK